MSFILKRAVFSAVTAHTRRFSYRHAYNLAMASSSITQTKLKDGLKLLSLDGGGVEGISSLLILDRIMNRIKEQQKLKQLPKPCEYFDLIGGTSTGGLIALMLFRLRMNTTDAIKQFKTIAKSLFSPRIFGWSMHNAGDLGYWAGNGFLWLKSFVNTARFETSPLEEAIDKIVDQSYDPDDKIVKGKSTLLKNPDGKARMFVCATRVDKGEAVLFRSYISPSDAGSPEFQTISITDAACATSATPTYFPSRKVLGVDFWDGGLLHNNPISQVWNARYDLAEQVNQEPVVALLLSIGTGYDRETETLPEGFLGTAKASLGYVTNTRGKHEDFRQSLRRVNLRKDETHRTYYRRLDARIGASVNLDDYKNIQLLIDATTKWMDETEVDRKLLVGQKPDSEPVAV